MYAAVLRSDGMWHALKTWTWNPCRGQPIKISVTGIAASPPNDVAPPGILDRTSECDPSHKIQDNKAESTALAPTIKVTSLT
jgi:hypothetical protein